MSASLQSTKAISAILFASVLWGTTGTAASFTQGVSPLATGAFAMGIGGVLLCLGAARELYNDRMTILSQGKTILLGGLSVALYPLAFYSSMHLSGVAVGTVISIASAPFFAALFEKIFNQKSVSMRWMLSFAIGVLGIGFLALGKDQQPAQNIHSFNHSLGILLGLVAGLTYASYSWAGKSLIHQGLHGKSAMASQFGIAALLLLPSLALTGDNLFSGSINTSVALYMAVIPMFVGYLLFGFGLKYVDASTATLLTLLEPVIATLLAIVIVRETFMAIGWIGIGLILICLLIQATSSNTSSAPKSKAESLA